MAPASRRLHTPLTATSEPSSTLHLPRILCLHGGGTNTRIFRAQCRILRAFLQPYVRLVFAEAPYASKPGPDVVCVYSDWGPFRSWLPPPDTPLSTEQDISNYTEDIDWCLQAAIEEDNLTGATGEIIGLLGFSQGARMAASLLLRTQENMAQHTGHCLPQFRFAVLLAGRGPFVQLHTPSESPRPRGRTPQDRLLLHLPTVHVHGLLDHGLPHHQELLGHLCAAGSTTLIEWDGGHRVPIKTKDVSVVVAAILDVVRRTGATT
ncbi:hypothetical protein VHEMI01587 [[Torrubiella] hemipterigena]|uniref:Serine hydrolase domain-containing protein n=1 Tax=[Torrubiella] hemipterigena TaxID=1531966 RepID=A0A0A1T5S4_9HYPO|nr:hypothetical protein VHEMI01587 [[Torrubiella] hemipterigena]